MKQITKAELIKMIDETKGATFVSVDIESDPRMKKAYNPYMGAVKLVTLSGAINFDYENAVNNQLQREGKEADFTSKPRSWGIHEGNWITHKGQHYLTVKVQSNSEPVYMLDGKVISTDEVKPYLPESSKPHTQAALDKEVVVRDIKIESIKKLRMAGEEFEII
jgi:hypothetical protein